MLSSIFAIALTLAAAQVTPGEGNVEAKAATRITSTGNIGAGVRFALCDQEVIADSLKYDDLSGHSKTLSAADCLGTSARRIDDVVVVVWNETGAVVKLKLNVSAKGIPEEADGAHTSLLNQDFDAEVPPASKGLWFDQALSYLTEEQVTTLRTYGKPIYVTLSSVDPSSPSKPKITLGVGFALETSLNLSTPTLAVTVQGDDVEGSILGPTGAVRLGVKWTSLDLYQIKTKAALPGRHFR